MDCMDSDVPKKPINLTSLSQIDIIDYSHISDFTLTTTSVFTDAVPSNYLRCEKYAYFYDQVLYIIIW